MDCFDTNCGIIFEMKNNITHIKDKKDLLIKRLTITLKDLREEEVGMSNPLLKDWFLIRNKIRNLERKIKDLKNTTL